MFRLRAMPTCNDITSRANCVIISVSILVLYCFNLSSCKSATAISFNDSSKRKTNNGKALFFQFNPEKKKEKRHCIFTHQNPWYIPSSHCLPYARGYELPEHIPKLKSCFLVFAVNSRHPAICSKDCTNSREQDGHGPKYSDSGHYIFSDPQISSRQ